MTTNYNRQIKKAVKSTLILLQKYAANPLPVLDEIINFTLYTGCLVCKCRNRYQRRNKLDSLCFSTDDEIGSCPLQTRGGSCAGGDSSLYRMTVLVRKDPTKERIKRLKILLLKKYNAISKLV